jgi:hypothetical protein
MAERFNMIEKLLSRLDGVKKTGPGKWQCRCPAHNDKSPSLSILDDNGRIVIYCFAGCETIDVIGAVGMTFDELFPSEYKGDHKPVKQLIYPSEAMKIIRFETQVVIASAYAMRNNTMNQNDLDRLEVAMTRINRAYEGAGL